jgi:rhamnosyltransferase
MPRILAVILSYHPDHSIVENLEALLSQVDHIVIVDNESSEKSQNIFGTLSDPKISVIANEANNGVAIGFNQGLRWGLERSFEYFLLMDQDSRAEFDMVEKLYSVITQHQLKVPLVMVGPNHELVKSKRSPAASSSERVALLITSGSLFSKTVIERLGLYDERLFIDHVDHDFCLRLSRAGGHCLKVSAAFLHHKFGAAKAKTFLGKTFYLQEYSQFRRYHMMRNRIVLYKRYGMFLEKWFWLDLRSAMKDFVKLIFFEPEKKTKIFALIRGVVDGLAWKD